MKIRYYSLMLFVFAIGIINVNAESSIEYNLTIEKDLNFIENNVYMIDYSDVDNTSYNFLTSILNDDIYFNPNNKVKYIKNKSNTGSQYKVILKNDYSSIFLRDSRILNECFFDFDYENDGKYLKFSSETPFLCSHRADKITIKIKTDLNVISSNAETVSDNVYIWSPKDDNFRLKINLAIPKIDEEMLGPMVDKEGNMVDSDGNVYDEEGNIIVEETEDTDEISNEDVDAHENVINPVMIVIIAFVGIAFLGIVLIVLKLKKNNLNQI